MTGETSHCYNEEISFNFLGLTYKISFTKAHCYLWGGGGTQHIFSWGGTA